jgi:hypothetical protein
MTVKQIYHFRMLYAVVIVLTMCLLILGGEYRLKIREAQGSTDSLFVLLREQQAEIRNLRQELAKVPSPPIPAPTRKSTFADRLTSADRLKRNADFQKDLNQLHIAPDPSIEKVAALARVAIKQGASPDVESSEGIRALHLAAFLNDEELTKLAIQQGANVNVQDRDGFTPLHVCAMVGSPEVARLLLANGADKNVRDRLLKTPLQRAEESDESTSIRNLLAPPNDLTQ